MPGNVFKSFVCVFAICVRIYQHAVAALASEEVVEGCFECLAFDVPERDVDGGNRGHGYGPTPPVCAAIEILPDIFCLKRVATNDAWDHVFGEITCNGEFAPVQSGIA